MEEKKTTSRFGESAGGQRPTGSYRTPPAGSYRSRPEYQQAQARRRPTGFGTVGQAPKPEALVQDEAELKEKKRLEKRLAKEQKRLDKQDRQDQPRKRREKKAHRGLKALLIALAGVLILAALMVIFFGNSTEGYHQLPTIIREEDVQATPDAYAPQSGGSGVLPQQTAAPTQGTIVYQGANFDPGVTP